MSTDSKIDLSQIPLNILIKEVESRKAKEVDKLVSGINENLQKLNELGLIPYNKFLSEDDNASELYYFYDGQAILLYYGTEDLANELAKLTGLIFFPVTELEID